MKTLKKYENLDFVLLIDDDDASNFYNEEIISSCNIQLQIDSVYNGKEALEYLKCEGKYKDRPKYPKPGIIFLDINMPVMNGWEFLDEYQQLPEEQKGLITLMMLTTSVNPEDLKKAKKYEVVNGYLYKPMSEKYFKEFVEKNFKLISR